MSPIKILGVSGSPRKGKNTGSLLQASLDATQEAGAETERLSLADLSIARAQGVGRRVAEVVRALRGTMKAE
jgi:multimeric flavodoxin WrbA